MAIPEAAADRKLASRWIAPALIICAYVCLVAFTASADPGDTRDYANSIAERFAGRDLFFWESGHLLWRPLGYLAVLVFHPAHAMLSRAELYADIVHLLTAISVTMGAVALLAFLALLRRLRLPNVPAVGATLAMALTCALLNYAQTGTSYVPSFAMLIVAHWAAVRADDRASPRSVAPGLAIAVSVLFWLPMVFVAPVAAASPLILRGDARRRLTSAVVTCAISGALVIAAYLAVAWIVDVRSISQLHTWFGASAHGIRDSGGAARAAIGLARSVLSMPELGITAKRHMLADPYSPATMADVVHAGLYRVVLFYAAGIAMVLTLALRRQFRVLALLAITAIPVLVLAVAWQGGDLERYFALFPALFLAVGAALSTRRPRASIIGAAILLALLAGFNLRDYSRRDAAHRCDVLVSRLRSVPTTPDRPTLLVTLGVDALTTMRGRCPDAPVLERPDNPKVLDIFTPHVENAVRWRQLFANRALAAWQGGGRVWISTRLLESKPAPEWHWAEGDDRRVHWEDFPTFFGRLALGKLGRGEAPFVEVLASPANLAALDSIRGTP